MQSCTFSRTPPATGLPPRAASTPRRNLIANFSCSDDGVGNPLTRADGNSGISEGFGYDSLNRLTESSLTASDDTVAKYFSYDSVGNLLNKSDVGNYAYPEPGLAHPHGVLSIDGDAITATFSYDANGNQTGATGISRTVAFNAANRPASIMQGAFTLNFADGSITSGTKRP
jgi:hypothetical protein